ncbi:Na+/H+ antiporter NhaA [Arenibacter sp. N53]|jgi:NhaA family Na+:H+ antiporter|uniref:Na+/H+ antiporter NhaA n=1 Tax=Arenibacter TaxID=178469 RepID=UPI000853051D|nr:MULTISPECIES: Na+/H+ antiporter NhaA [Arenibacter]MCM4151994.1 Na+/H+ antiporter NhaA [Arenibacter sp. N53]GBF20605.1 Na(+)/H(+) antiporter NhaA [Arenibacter sp. NBRC 103722]
MHKQDTNSGIMKFFGNTAKELNNNGVILFITVVIAMVWANSPWKEYYIDLMQTDIAFTIGTLQLSEPLLLWINDGLMALFFLQVGLELKREIIGGKLSSPKSAVLPIGAAIGGMVLPALIYFMFNSSGEASNGWGIPMATDIAFSLGVLAIVGKRLPSALRVFLITLAIVDDLGGVLVIALFYTSGISEMDLLHGLLFFGALIIGNYAGVRSTWFYAIIGIGGVWLAFFFSGIHPTIAGILTAFAIPGRVKIKENTFLNRLDNLHKKFQETKSIRGALISKTQLDILEDIKTTSSEAETPLQKLERSLNPIVSFIILPLFALANTGIHLHGDLLKVLSSPVSLGIGLGLILGKFIGIAAFSRILVALKLAKLPEKVNWNMIYGIAFLGGIGFTMSLFINELAFTDESLIFTAKVSILFASMLAGVIGAILLHRNSKKLITVK